MIFHSANNLKKKIKRKRKGKKKKEKKKEKRPEKNSIKSPYNNSNLVHTFQAWPSSF
jgi:hypothetical protein